MLFYYESGVLTIDLQGRFGLDVAADDGTREQGFDLRLNETLQGSCAVGGIVSRVNDKLLCLVAQLDAYLLILQALVEIRNQEIYDTVDVFLGEWLVEHNFVKSVHCLLPTKMTLGAKEGFQLVLSTESFQEITC